jgi:hypothetical protein
MTQIKTGLEIVKEHMDNSGKDEYCAELADIIDANTALAVAEATKNIHLREAAKYDQSFSALQELLRLKSEELELCKSQCLLLSDYVKGNINLKGVMVNGNALTDLAEKTLSAAKETIEAYRNEIVQEAVAAEFGCPRSHPHENMGEGCKLLTRVAKAENALRCNEIRQEEIVQKAKSEQRESLFKEVRSSKIYGDFAAHLQFTSCQAASAFVEAIRNNKGE